ncbi:cardiolipin synthase [Secundilactobacillus paracollinoides]|uniref:cardiolipin synthase n=1 Tax=Secundilactobacillus paracollinoides TaxID=240427 RepID=UPI00081A666C|nr:cardiolipin synthase [Secundilactobacillus paracollinoides]ANZ63357.1 cardiolipin synthase [Secundilactobacillus paracollinoides]
MAFILTILILIVVINLIVALFTILREERDISATWAWLLVLVLMPVFGFILYLFAGRKISKKRIFDIKAQERLGLNQLVDTQKQLIQQGALQVPDNDNPEIQEIVNLFLETDRAVLTTNNAVQVFTDGEKKFAALFDDIRHARHHINVEYFTFYNDEIGNQFVRLLEEKAAEGVAVRVIYDTFGSHGGKKHMFKHLTQLGGQVYPFLSSRLALSDFQLNFRDHRKIVVIDGKIGYTGGFNVGDQYVNRKPKFGYWRDTHLRIEGHAVLALQSRFFLDWNATAKRHKVTYDKKYFPVLNTTGTTSMQIVSSGPDSEVQQIKKGYLKLINSARQSIAIQSPYFVPDESILEALTVAALSGIHVRLMIPDQPDHPFVYRATEYFSKALLKAGGQVYRYHGGFMHAKMIVVDGEVASVGSANMDIRSFKLNFEINAFMYDVHLATKLMGIFENDIALAEEMTLGKFAQQSLWVRCKQALSRLFSPIL